MKRRVPSSESITGSSCDPVIEDQFVVRSVVGRRIVAVAVCIVEVGFIDCRRVSVRFCGISIQPQLRACGVLCEEVEADA